MSIATARPLRAPRLAALAERRLDRDRLPSIASIAIPGVVATVLCLYQLTTRSLWLDEAATVAIASQHGAAFGAALAHDGGNMLGYYGLMHVLIGAFGNGAFVLRLPSAIGAVATVCLVAVLGLRLFGRRVALAAGLLAAVSLPLVYWGQNTRGYALMVALIAGSFLALVIAVQSDRPLGAWIAYAGLTVAAVYAGLEAALVIPAQAVVLLWYRERWRAFAAGVAVTAVCCAPLAVLASSRGSGQLFWVPAPSAKSTNQVLQSLASSGLQPNFYTGTGGVLLVLTAALLFTALVRIVLLLRSPARRATAFGPVLALSWVAVPFGLALLESTVGQSIFQARYLLVSLPAVALLLGWTLLARPAPAVIGFGALAVVIALRAAQLVPSYGVSPENWRAATAYVLARSAPGDCVAFYPLDNRMPFQYYLGSRAAAAPRSILPAVPWSHVRSYVEDYASLSPAALAGLPSRCSRVWLLTSHEGAVGGPPISRANYTRLETLTIALLRSYPLLDAWRFGTAKTITVALFTGAA